MNELKINPEFEELLPALTDAELSQLEESLLSKGLENGIMTWNGFIIDGHNRWQIIQKHDLEWFEKNRDLDFDSEDEVLEWILRNQLGRRNLNANQRTLYIGELYSLQKKKIGAPDGNANAEKQCGQNVHIVFPDESEDLTIEYDEGAKPPKQTLVSTAQNLGRQFGIGEKTVRRAEVVAKAVEVLPKEEKTDFLAGKTSQKTVIAKAREINTPRELLQEPPVDVAKFDDFTNLAKHYGNAFVAKLRELKELVEKAENSFIQRGMDFKDFGEDIYLLELDDAMQTAVSLRYVEKCGYCQSKGCDLCNQGYVIKGDKENG